ncbi:MAG: fatty acid desaturase family protein [Polyangiales bacterium]
MEGFDPSRVDFEGFLSELRAIGRDIEADLGDEDLAHLRKMERWGRACSTAGAALAGFAPNPLSMALLSLGRSARWMLMHHIGHRGYDQVPNVPPEYTSKVFARDKRRFLDWPDWQIPEAWIYEHNVLHHSYTGEDDDPDLIERNSEAMRAMNLPRPLRHALLGALALTWRFSYYAPITLRTWRNRGRHATEQHHRELWLRCYAPYALLHFVLFPALFLPFGPWAAFSAWCNQIGAEALCNLHTFLVVGPNHTGDDLYRFDGEAASKAERLVRQVIGSVDYRTGGDLNDFLHLFLNYQIEHHLWPDIPMRQYQKVQPKVRALCEKYGVPYVQGGILGRVRKMWSVAIGDTIMRRFGQGTLASNEA